MEKEIEIYRNMIFYYALKYKGVWKDIYNAIKQKEEWDEEWTLEAIKKTKANWVTVIDSNYPERFKFINNPPFIIFYYGDLSLIDSDIILGVVGSRNASSYGKRACLKILSELDKDIVILSGLACGIDALAHQYALDNNMKTIAVLGNGIDRCYPKENFLLYQKIKKEGLIISEYPYTDIVSNKSFLFRNRLIGGISSALFVPDVKDRSGTLVSVRFALDAGKPILVVPTSIFEPELLNNQLILEGACPVSSGKDVKDEIN